MLLAIDVGNTNTEFGVFEGENLLGSFRMMTKSNATSDEIGLLVCQYFQRFGLDRTRLEAVMVASVVPQVMYTLTAAMVKYLGLKPIVADVDVDSGLRYGPMVTDERLGPDLVGGLCGGYGEIRPAGDRAGLRHRHHRGCGGRRWRVPGRLYFRRASGDHGRADGQRRHAAQRGAE